MPKTHYKLDQKFIDQLALIETGGSRIYFDQSVKGFGVSVGKTAKSFILQRETNRKSVRVTIARTTEITVAKAREQARNLLFDIRNGHNPNAEKKEDRKEAEQGTTLQKLLDEHIEVLQLQGRKHCADVYPKRMKQHLADWLPLSVEFITRDMVIERHRKIGTKTGKSGANAVFRIVRALYNNYRVDHPDFHNPVEILSLKKLWFQETARVTRIKPHEMRPWVQALLKIPNTVHREYLLFLLFNGLRKNEAMTLSWKQVDFVGRSFCIEHTKNKKPLELPFSTFTEALLKRMWEMRDLSDPKTSQWVFPSKLSVSGHLEEPKKSLAMVNEASGMNIRLHDLRRTFVTEANSVKLPSYTTKKLVNHSLAGDVTASVYTIIDIEELRKPMQEIADRLMELIHKVE